MTAYVPLGDYILLMLFFGIVTALCLYFAVAYTNMKKNVKLYLFEKGLRKDFIKHSRRNQLLEKSLK